MFFYRFLQHFIVLMFFYIHSESLFFNLSLFSPSVMFSMTIIELTSILANVLPVLVNVQTW